MAAESDEILARKLQAEFDAEDAVHKHQVTVDARIAASMSRAHDMSDSDSDATVEPPDYSNSLDGSQDLFDASSGSSSFMSKSSPSSLDRSRQRLSSSPQTPSKLKAHTLATRVSQTHGISDSENDSADDTRLSKPAKALGHKSRNSSTVCSPKASPKPQANSLTKKVSKGHDVSDSGNDSADDSKASKSVSDSGRKGKSRPTTGSPSSSQAQNTLSRQLPRLSPHASNSDSKTFMKNTLSRQLPKLSPHASSSDSKTFMKNGGSGSDLKKSNSDQKLSRGDENNAASQRRGTRPTCKYGDRCYRTNPDHFQEFDHEDEKRAKRKSAHSPNKDAEAAKKKARTDEGAGPSFSRGQDKEEHTSGTFTKTVADVVSEFQPLSFFLTKVSGIDRKFNSTGAVSIQDILSPLMGNLEASCQFNFLFDIPWLINQYPMEFRTLPGDNPLVAVGSQNKPLLLVHGEQGHSEAKLKEEGAPYPHISFCRAKLEIMYGTHHTKMMLLLYDCGMRVVIHTANMVPSDWHQRTQGVWISPMFPRLSDKDAAAPSSSVVGRAGVQGDSPTGFKSDLLAYLAAYRVVPLTAWEKHIQRHDMSSANVYIIASTPGRHAGAQKSTWGHLKLRKVLQKSGPEKKDVGSWPVYGQFSSIGSLGSSPDQWLCDEWLGSLSQCQGMMGTPLHHSKLQLVYPSKENVRLCLEGYAGGGCLPYSLKTAQKQIYLNNFVRKWGSEGRGRTEAIPHIKTYTRVAPDFSQVAWFLVTSANLSKAAWGALEKQKTQLMIRSYEIGVLLLPNHFGVSGSFPVAKTAEEVIKSKKVMLPLPYDMPPPAYQKGDRIWMWDVPCVDIPDTHGKKYCPRL